MRFKKFMAVAMTFATSLSLAACANSGDSTDTGSTGGEPVQSEVLKVGLNADPPTLDPLMSTGAIVRDVTKYIFEGLFEMDENYEPSLQLCESYDANEDYTEFTFKLREGVYFHNGDELTADDVVASLNRWLAKNNAIKSLITSGEQFVKVDDYTVTISLEKPCYTLPAAMCAPAQFAAIMPEEVVDAATEDSGISEYIGTGPMEFGEWVQNQYVLLEKNEEYEGPGYELTGEAGDKTIYFDEVYMYFVTDATMRTAGIQSGEYDIVSNVSYDDVDMLSADSNVKLDKSLMGYTTVIMDKVEGTLGTNETLRAAITYALDVDEIMNAAYPTEGYAEVYASMMPEGSKWYSEVGTESVNTKDMAKAKELLAESGYDGTPIKVITNQVYPQHYNGTLVMVQQLEALGLTVDLQVVDWTTMLEYKKTKGTYDLYYMDYPAVTTPTSLRTISQTDEGWTVWPEFLELLDKVTAAKSDEEAVAAWEACQEYVLGRYSYVPMGYSYYCNATSADIEGYHSISCQSIYGAYKVS